MKDQTLQPENLLFFKPDNFMLMVFLSYLIDGQRLLITMEVILLNKVY